MKKGMMMLMAITAAVCLTACGCAVVHGSAGDTSYLGWAFGEKASSTLAGLAVVENSVATNGAFVVMERSVGVEAAGATSETHLMEILGKVFMAGIASMAPTPMAAQPTAPPSSAETPEGIQASADATQ